MARGENSASTSKEEASAGGTIVPIVLLLLLGGGAGFGYGMLVRGPNTHEVTHSASALEQAAHGASAKISGADVGNKPGSDWGDEELVPMQPLIVKLSGDAGKWLRLEGGVAFSRASKVDRRALVARLGEDLMLFLGSTKLERISSPTGLEFLRDDMDEIVHSRTKGQAVKFVLKSLVVE